MPATGLAAGDNPNVISVVGQDKAVWVTHSDNSSFRSWGGKTLDNSSVVVEPTNNHVLVMVSGTDHHLYLSVNNSGFRQVDTPSTHCYQPDMALVDATHLVAACRGSDNALWASTTTFDPTFAAFPAFTSWHSLGGVLGNGVGIVVVSGTPVYYVTAPQSSSPNVWFNSGSGWHSIPFMICKDVPAVALDTVPVTPVTYLACRGQNHNAYITNNSTGSFASPANLGGYLLKAPGLVLDLPSETWTLYVEGQDTRLWARSGTGTTPNTGWINHGGTLTQGAAAAQCGATCSA
jgi:hypothetical protein